MNFMVPVGIGEDVTEALATVTLSVDDIEVDFNIVVGEADIPIHVCIDNMDRREILFVNPTD